MRERGADDEWDAVLQRHGGHFLQSRAWQRVQQRLGYEVLQGRDGSWLWAGSVRAGRFPRYVYVPYGPSGPIIDEALIDIRRSADEHNLDFARIEPLAAPSADALRRIRAARATPVQPRWTWVLRLEGDESDLRRGLSAGHRGSINAAPRRGLSFRSSRDPAAIEVFCELQRRALTAGSAYRSHRADYFRTLAEVLFPERHSALYVAEAEGNAVAAAIAFDFHDTRYYAYAASDPATGRRLGAAAPLVWQMIQDARAEGMRLFDFWGVAPPRTEGHRWEGFSQFKRSFGGQLIERPGSWEIPVRPLRHRAFSLTRALKR